MREDDTDSFTHCFQQDPDLIAKVDKYITKTQTGDGKYVCKVNNNY